MNSQENQIECGKHGCSDAATVCCHLIKNNGAPLGFIENSNEPGDLQAWCYACEHVFLIENEMTDRFRKFCDFAVVCESCYADIREHHTFETQSQC